MRRTFIGIVFFNLLFIGIWLFGRVAWLEQWGGTTLGRGFILAFFALSFVGILYFVVDAFRRQYDQERELAIALALTGVASCGLTTILYYLRWGCQPIRRVFHDQFCEMCVKSSSEYPRKLDLWTFNYLLGGRLVGRSCECSECGSTVRTYCFYLFGVPLYCAGSFRVQCLATDQYLLRKCDFHWPHLLTILLMPLAITGFVLWIWWMD